MIKVKGMVQTRFGYSRGMEDLEFIISRLSELNCLYDMCTVYMICVHGRTKGFNHVEFSIVKSFCLILRK